MQKYSLYIVWNKLYIKFSWPFTKCFIFKSLLFDIWIAFLDHKKNNLLQKLFFVILSLLFFFGFVSKDEIIGKIEDYFDNAADQTILVVKCNDGSIKYIPDLEEFVEEVDMDASKIYVDLIKGM